MNVLLGEWRGHPPSQRWKMALQARCTGVPHGGPPEPRNCGPQRRQCFVGGLAGERQGFWAPVPEQSEAPTWERRWVSRGQWEPRVPDLQVGESDLNKAAKI